MTPNNWTLNIDCKLQLYTKTKLDKMKMTLATTITKLKKCSKLKYCKEM